MRKLVTLLLVLSCMTLGAFALEEDTAASIDLVSPETAATAYMDIEDATPAMREEILKARNEIIFHNSWVVDGYGATYTAPDGTVEELPLFSSLFPGWDVPRTQTEPAEVLEIKPCPPVLTLLGDWWETQRFQTYLNAATSENACEFATFPSVPGTEATTRVAGLTAARNCNIGYSNVWGENIAYREYIPLGASFGVTSLIPSQYLTVGLALTAPLVTQHWMSVY